MKYITPPHLIDGHLNIAIVGCGGTGSHVLYNLANIVYNLKQCGRQHPIHVSVFDPDIVQQANIGRHSFYPADVGGFKAPLLVDRINKLFGYQWKGIPTKLQTVAYANVIIGCVDNPEARDYIHRTIKRAPILWIDSGNSQTSGQVILGEGKKMSKLPRLKTVVELYPEILKPQTDQPSCSTEEALQKQDALINTLSATLTCQILWQLLRYGEIEHQGYFFNLQNGVVPIPIPSKT